MPGRLMLDRTKVVEAIKPQTGGSARSGDWVSLKGYDHLTIIVQIAMGNAATTAITVDKATDVSGGGNSDGITMNNIYKATGNPISGSDAFTKLAAAASITSGAGGAGSEIYVIEIEASELGDYDCVQVELGASHAANLVSALYVLGGARFQSQAASWAVSAIID